MSFLHWPIDMKQTRPFCQRGTYSVEDTPQGMLGSFYSWFPVDDKNLMCNGRHLQSKSGKFWSNSKYMICSFQKGYLWTCQNKMSFFLSQQVYNMQYVCGWWFQIIIMSTNTSLWIYFAELFIRALCKSFFSLMNHLRYMAMRANCD